MQQTRNNICPRCGAIMQQHECEYCGYCEEVETKDKENKTNGSFDDIFNIGDSQHVKNLQQKVDDALSHKEGRKRKWVAILLCLFGGWFGLHHFYLGKHALGLLYIFTLGLFYFGWIIDLFSLFTGSMKDNNGNDLV